MDAYTRRESQASTKGGLAGSSPRQLGRTRRAVVRLLAVLGLVTFNFMILFAVNDATDRIGEEQVLEPPGSTEAQIGADHPGEALHVVGSVAALVVGVSGLAGLVIKPDRAGSATHVAAAALAWLLASAVVGDPDNHGGQGGPVDVAFVVMALPALVAALVAAPWRSWRGGALARPRLLVLGVLGLPWFWHAAVQGLMQRNTWPPLADPHHQAHWFVASLLGFMTLLVLAGAALAGRGWRAAAAVAGTSGLAAGVTSLLAPDAASALHPAWATAAVVWGAAALALTWQESRHAAVLSSTAHRQDSGPVMPDDNS